MKKFIYGCMGFLFMILIGMYIYYTSHFYFPMDTKELSVLATNRGKEIYINEQGEFKNFEIKGVNLGAGKPGEFATDFAIKKDEYLRWFEQIQDMGANCIRVYTILGANFYDAVYEYNKDNENPLYIIHGLWLNDYVLNSRKDAFDEDFLERLIIDGYDMIDIIHGNKLLYLSNQTGTASGNYTKNISQWVIGYILGVEWEDITVEYTNRMNLDKSQYQGTYMSTTEDASPFEAALAELGDKLIQYETKRYAQQRLVAFSNWPTTDPFDYSEVIKLKFQKVTKVDVEHIKMGEAFKGGTFASYHIYPYYPDYLHYEEGDEEYKDPSGNTNTYYAYLKKINDHHTIPVVIAEFGIPSARGMAQVDQNTGRNQGRMSETEQGEAVVSAYKDIKDAGCDGAIVFTWQDEWFKRTWNTMNFTDLTKTPYWSDYQTNEQYFGLLSFDPGKERSISYVDENTSEWTQTDIVYDHDGLQISVKQDERYMYIMAHKAGLSKGDTVYIPLDITPKTGAKTSIEPALSFDQGADFIIKLQGEDESRIVVQERYEALRAIFNMEARRFDAYEFPPKKDTSVFKPIELLLQADSVNNESTEVKLLQTYETGKLTYGNANPESAEYNSLADFYYSKDAVEIKIPWLLLNFSNPSEGVIHDDYYEHYGIENLKIDNIYIGGQVGDTDKPIEFEPVKLKKWRDRISYHERLKPVYYRIKDEWSK